MMTNNNIIYLRLSAAVCERGAAATLSVGAPSTDTLRQLGSRARADQRLR